MIYYAGAVFNLVENYRVNQIQTPEGKKMKLKMERCPDKLNRIGAHNAKFNYICIGSLMVPKSKYPYCQNEIQNN
jgi:hypothetical protein